MTSAIHLILSDVHRVTGRSSYVDAARQALMGECFRYNVALRLGSRSRGKFASVLVRLWIRRLRRRLGINIPASTRIGPGLFIGHAGGIVVNAGAVIGANCNISHGVTIGVSRGRRGGVPIIGDRVYIGPGAVITGSVTIGDDVAIGANAVVTRDVESGMTAIGNPAHSRPGGSHAYVNRLAPIHLR